jgi:TonB family protein
MMYNQKTSRRRALRPLLLLPALGAAFWISQLPAVASALSTVSSAELPSAVSADKVSENPSDKQVTVTTLPPTSGRVMNVTTVSSGGAATAAAVPTQSVATDQKAATTDGAEEEEVSTAVQQMPEFPGGTRALMEYVVANLQHPKGTENISGRVVLKFVVEKDGSIGDVQVIRSLDPRLDAEAIRVVKSFPKWTPGIKDGKSVAVWYAIPITFRAMGDDTKDAKAAGDGSSSTSVSTSVSTVTDDSGKTSSSTYSSVHIKENGETIHFLLSPDGLPDNVAYYVNGERFDGNLKDIPASDVESMTIDKSNPGETAIRINLKNK